MRATLLAAAYVAQACSSKPADPTAASCEHDVPPAPAGAPPSLLWNFHRDVGDGPEYSIISLGLDARYALAGSFAGFTLFDVRDGRRAWQFFDHDGDYLSLAFKPGFYRQRARVIDLHDTLLGPYGITSGIGTRHATFRYTPQELTAILA